jgi:microcystin-dependent protein
MENFKIKNGIDTTSSNAIIPSGSLIIKALPPTALSLYTTDSQCLALGAIPCDGRLLNSSTNPEYTNLYSIIGSIYGGTGATSFAVPDLRTSIKYLAGSSAGTPSITNNSNTVTHTHTLSINNSVSNFSQTTLTSSHLHNVNFNASGAVVDSHVHSRSSNPTFGGGLSGAQDGYTQAKVDGNATAAGYGHQHTTVVFNAGANIPNGLTTAIPNAHTHAAAAASSNSVTDQTHGHNISLMAASNQTSTTGSSTIPYIYVLYFIKI